MQMSTYSAKGEKFWPKTLVPESKKTIQRIVETYKKDTNQIWNNFHINENENKQD